MGKESAEAEKRQELVADLHNLPEAILGRGPEGNLNLIRLHEFARNIYTRAAEMLSGDKSSEVEDFVSGLHRLCDEIADSSDKDRELDGPLYNQARDLYGEGYAILLKDKAK